MIIYADILIVLNLIVNYFLLLAVDKIIVRKAAVWRMLLSALSGGIFSLYIFLPQSVLIAEFLVRLLMAAAMTLIAFGYRSFKTFIRNTGIFFAVTCCYAGIMIALWYIFKPQGMFINNSVVYFSISPIILILSSVIGYVIFVFLKGIFSKSAGYAGKCDVTAFADGRYIQMTAIIDTGNSIEDFFGKSEIIISEKQIVCRLFETENLNNERLNTRYRALPCSTVSGGGILDGYRCDKAVVLYEKRTIELNKPILAVSKTAFNDDYNAIINPRILS